MTAVHYFNLQHFDKWWHDSTPAHLNSTVIPTYHLGKFILAKKSYELFHNHELVVMIPACYRNGLRFLNHIIICFQELRQHLGPSHHWNMLQLKYEDFGRELLVLSKIREEFIQEVRSGCLIPQPEAWYASWASPVLDSFLAYQYYCGSVNPYHKSYMMNVTVDDPQTYNWRSWANKQEIPGLWGRLPEHSAEYQEAMFDATRAKIALEPNTESSGPCSEMWCKGIVNLMVQIRQNISTVSKPKVFESSIDIVGNDVHKTLKKGRGRPKGVLNSNIRELPLMPRSPMKLRNKNSAGWSSLSNNDVIIPERLVLEIVEAEDRDIIQVPKLQTLSSNVFLISKRVDKAGCQTTSSTLSNSPKKHIRTPAKNDVPALDLSTLFVSKRLSSVKKSSLLSKPATEATPALPDVMQSQSYLHTSEPSENSGSSHHQVIDQVMSKKTSFGNVSSLYLSSETLDEVALSSPTGSLNYSEELDHLASTPPNSPPLSEDDLQFQVSASSSLHIMEEYEGSPSIPPLSLSSQEESAQQPITSKTSKGTLIFIKSLNDQFVYDSVTYVPNQLQIKSKEKSKQSLKYIQSVQKNDEMLTSESNKTNQSQRPNEEKNKGKKKAGISDEPSVTHSEPGTKSVTTLTLSANMSKVAKACQKSQALSKPESLTWNEKFLKFFSCLGHEWTQSNELQSNIKQQIGKAMVSKDVQKQIKAHMHVIVQYVCWMKQQKGIDKLPEEVKVGFQALFKLLEM